MKILALHTGLFPDARTVADAVQRLAPPHELERIDLTRRDLTDGDWDRVVAAILAADRVVTT